MRASSQLHPVPPPAWPAAIFNTHALTADYARSSADLRLANINQRIPMLNTTQYRTELMARQVGRNACLEGRCGCHAGGAGQEHRA